MSILKKLMIFIKKVTHNQMLESCDSGMVVRRAPVKKLARKVSTFLVNTVLSHLGTLEFNLKFP